MRPMSDNPRARLAQLLKDHAVIHESVKLSSGKRSSYYIDARQVLLDPEGAALSYSFSVELAPDGSAAGVINDTGDGFEVECASCHDPHGVPSDGAGSTFNPAFLRVANSESNLCLSCHVK